MKLIAAVALCAVLPVQSEAQRGQSRASVVLANARVRVYRTDAGSTNGVEHGPGVTIRIGGQLDPQARATWREDAAAPMPAGSGDPAGLMVIVQPLKASGVAAPPKAGSSPGSAPFTGMSFKPLFENPRVSVLSARMEVGAQEGFHTHGSDTLVVHLSGGEIEDTADGKTVVNRWKPGDVEFEALGSSHSARNVGAPVDVILVALKP
jgi:quercetin dioxygenase-like cupin family protein